MSDCFDHGWDAFDDALDEACPVDLIAGDFRPWRRRDTYGMYGSFVFKEPDYEELLNGLALRPDSDA